MPSPRRGLRSASSLVLLVLAAWTTSTVAADPGEPLAFPADAISGGRIDTWRWQRFQERLTGQPADAGLYPAESLELPAAAGFPGESGAAADGAWSQVPPPALWLHTMLYDPQRDRLLVVGGSGQLGPTADVWQLALTGAPSWQRLAPAGTSPTALSQHTAVYDAARDRVIVFGGHDGTQYLDDVWVLSLAGTPVWTRVDAGPGPDPRGWHAAVLDPARDRMIVFGGSRGFAALGDIWALSLAGTPAWTQLAPAGGGPGPRTAMSAVYDEPRDRIVFYGGIDGANETRTDVWALSLAGSGTWSQLLPAGTPPAKRNGASAIYDPVRQRLVLFGGGTGAPNLRDTWALSLAGSPVWTQLAPADPPAGRQFAAAVYDPIADRMLVFGGSSGPILSGTWALSLSGAEAWIPFSGTRRRGHVALHDGLRGRIVMFGGDDDGPLNDLWELGLGASALWLRLTPAGTPPAPRAFGAGIYDPQRDRMVIFGGRDSAPRGDLWELSFSGALAWRQLAPTGASPEARIDHAAVYDPLRHRMLVFGGASLTSVYRDVWALSLSGPPTWTQLAPAGSAPAARAGAAAIYDPGRDRLVVHGGYDKNLNALADTWELSLSGTPTWTRIYPAGAAPAARLGAAAVYDVQRDRLLLVGGTDLISSFGDTWELALAGSPAWVQLTPAGSSPAARSDHKAVYDAAADRLVLFGGSALGGGLLNDTWALTFYGTIDVAAARPTRPRLWSAWPNPARGATRISFEVPSETQARLAVFAADGRLVRELDAGRLPAGRHSLGWDGNGEGGSRLPAGVYLYRVTLGSERLGGKIVLLD